MLKCRELLRRGIVWKVGKGDNISFWYDNWIENRNLADILNISNENIPKSEAKVNEFIQDNVNWNIPKLMQTLNNHPII